MQTTNSGPRIGNEVARLMTGFAIVLILVI